LELVAAELDVDVTEPTSRIVALSADGTIALGDAQARAFIVWLPPKRRTATRKTSAARRHCDYAAALIRSRAFMFVLPRSLLLVSAIILGSCAEEPASVALPDASHAFVQDWSRLPPGV